MTTQPMVTDGADRSFDLDRPGSAAKKSRAPELALGALVLAVSALAALWLFTSSSSRTEVLALANDVVRGDTVEREDLVAVEIAADDSHLLLRPDQANELVGRVALIELPAGALAISSQFAQSSPLVVGEGIVGLDLAPGQVPSSTLSPGTTVAVVLTPTQPASESSTASASAPGEVLVETATVVESATTGSQSVYVALSMSEMDARAVTVAAALDRVSLIQVRRS